MVVVWIVSISGAASSSHPFRDQVLTLVLTLGAPFTLPICT